MYLKSLQLVGFKSFADKTDLQFSSGVTAVVGPNGCGKSNVSDAIRWVLGEQSAKALRGSEMADVIFNGSDTRPATSMAEVSLTFSDCQNVLKTGEFAGSEAHFDEVMITRRVFRDGSSEYFINKTACRLKDIQSLFMDTGIGRSSYSIMEQGKIDKILSSHPEDRRAIFEEAAGITKFKSQKKEALRKLEYTEANLTRVADIIREVKRQIGSLQRQASKARKYQALAAESKLLEVQLARKEYEELRSQSEALEKEVLTLQERLHEVRSQIEMAETESAQWQQKLSASEQQRQAILQQQRDLQSEIERLDTRIRHDQDRITEFETNIQNFTQEASDARLRLAELQNHHRNHLDTQQAASARRERESQELAAAQEAFHQAEQAEKKHLEHIHHLQQQLLQLEGSIAGLHNQVTTLDKQKETAVQRIQKLTHDILLLTEQRDQLSQTRDSLQTEIQAFKQSFEANRHAVLGGEDALRDAEQQCQNLSALLAAEQRVLSEKTSRRDVLRQLQTSYEGYLEGAQAILRHAHDPVERGKNQDLDQQMVDTLANLIDVEPRFSIALESILGQTLQAIVVTDCEAASRFVHELRSRNLGRALFAIQEHLPQPPPEDLKRDVILGSISWATDVVKAKPEASSFIYHLLHKVILVENIRQAFELRRYHPSLTIVTLEGDILNHQGILTAGIQKSSPLHLIGRRNEIVSLDAEIQQLESKVLELSCAKGDWEGRRALIRQNLGDRQQELRVQETDLTKKEAQVSAFQTQLREIEAKIAALEMEIRDLNQQSEEHANLSLGLRTQLDEAEQKRRETQALLNEANARQQELTQKRQSFGTQANDLRVSLATTEQQIQGLEQQLQHLESQISDVNQRIVARENDIRTRSQKIVELQGDIAQSHQHTHKRSEELNGITTRLQAVEEEKQNFNAQIHEQTERLRELRHGVDTLQKQITECEIHITRHRGSLHHLMDRVMRDHQIDLVTVELLPLKGSTPPPFLPIRSENAADSSVNAEAAPAEEGVPSPKNFEITDLAYDSWDAVSVRAAEVREKIQNIGPVNLEAVQEYDELEQRYTFLTRENDDLIASKQHLLEIIQKINKTSRQLFADTFEQVRTNFQTVFHQLFGGGKADLLLIDDGDPLESGIDIMAKPPGKQLQSISLLSGGERTMTAVSLLFAIFMVKPSPFCVLDEMDAPLDESNINRFTQMLEKFLAQSQFLLITHNKRTIAMADALYGVTMEERGVSKIVSVKFDRDVAPTKREDSSLSAEQSRPRFTVPESIRHEESLLPSRAP